MFYQSSSTTVYKITEILFDTELRDEPSGTAKSKASPCGTDRAMKCE